jgi:hypothetical protein
MSLKGESRKAAKEGRPRVFHLLFQMILPSKATTHHWLARAHIEVLRAFSFLQQHLTSRIGALNTVGLLEKLEQNITLLLSEGVSGDN